MPKNRDFFLYFPTKRETAFSHCNAALIGAVLENPLCNTKMWLWEFEEQKPYLETKIVL